MDKVNIDNITFNIVLERTETENAKSQISIKGTQINTVISGAVLEDCFQHGAYYLIIVSHDCPFEEGLDIYLYDSDNNIVDKLVVLWVYSTGVYKFITIDDNQALYFQFFNNRIYKLNIISRGQFGIPYFVEAFGVWRKLKLKKYLKLKKVKREDIAKLDLDGATQDISMI